MFFHYEPSQFLDWELGEALKSKGPVLFILLRNVPRDVALSEDKAINYLPAPLKELGFTFSYSQRATEKLLCNEYGIFITFAPGKVRVCGVKMHWDALWRVLWREIVHELKLTEDRDFNHVPVAYQQFAKAIEGNGSVLASLWTCLAIFSGAILASILVLFRWF